MNWIELTNADQLAVIKELSKNKPQVIFKHSTRCATSSMVKSRLEKSESPSNTDFYYLDLLRYRSLSNQIAEDFAVYHESPQVLLIKNTSCVYEESHFGIDMAELAEQVKLN